MKPVPLRGWPYGGRRSPAEILVGLGVDAKSPDRLAASLPFGPGDATCGSENELQAVVMGSREDVDLPRQIIASNYHRNVIRRLGRGELPKRALSGLERWLDENPAEVWENSWVRLPLAGLTDLARRTLEADLLADKRHPEQGQRGDRGRFLHEQDGRPWLRAPVSYLLKLALAECLGRQPWLPAWLRDHGLKCADHFLSDNTSPETFSFYVAGPRGEAGLGRSAADETGLRFLLTHLLTRFAEQGMGLARHGQRLAVYFAPLPPQRQRVLSECISDAFYRDLFMNPCLSGWDRGEEKHRYMHLCHEVLSRAQFNALGRLKEAGIIVNNLVVLPAASNISLANNGTHLSLGSRRLGAALADPASGFGPAHEKYLGDLVIKFVEHFLPLMVGTYSAAPRRLGFADFHPERVLSFLPYQLDYTHLRMLWRRWRKKAHLKLLPLGPRLTPFGPAWLDGALGRLPGLKGDLVPDYRLLDYLVAVMSTSASPALDGSPGNQERLKADLAALGVFHPKMAVYLPYRQRLFAQMGYAGFEGRHYSLFPSLDRDLARAVELQTLLTALAYRLIAGDRLLHSHIPDDPETESERRQIFFGAAVGLPTFFVKAGTANRLLAEILALTPGVRPSRRYPGYLRVRHAQFRQGCLAYLAQAGRDLAPALGLDHALTDLARRLEDPAQASAQGRLTGAVLARLGQRDPLKVEAQEFNRAAEDYYRQDLRQSHLDEAWAALERALAGPAWVQAQREPGWSAAMGRVLGEADPAAHLARVRADALAGDLPAPELARLIDLLLMAILARTRQAAGTGAPETALNGDKHGIDDAPVHRTA